MLSKANFTLVFSVALAALFLAGCLGESQQPTPTPTSTPVVAATPTPTAASTPTPVLYPGGKIEEAIEKALA
jgi:PBP1b-binding outer membrane lipoprotein LpoB